MVTNDIMSSYNAAFRLHFFFSAAVKKREERAEISVLL
jgi:hypothetical protein